ncbi:SprT family protein [Paenibacillus camelliae]|uniref:SprT family protein n=1 Tax=Paenibacillus camelliae TaxID=512410 RepID=UPI00204200F7|nr:SprT family protein [Paenibacillus camelliae]MCM3635161.1 SprT family protein [Paenibacillus camelliae]
MNNEELQQWVEEVSLQYFGRPFIHKATFNARLKATGGRYFTQSHNIEISPHQLAAFGKEETEKIIKHELCHYHLHILNRGYKHRDQDFKQLLAHVGGSRYCNTLPERKEAKKREYRYLLQCVHCGQQYYRKRRMDVSKYRCGRCSGKLNVKMLDKE